MKKLPGIQPSRGCTEPAAIALAAALAARALGTTPQRIAVRCDRATLKNAQAAYIPGARGARGAELAAALGARVGDPTRGLQVLDSVSEGEVERAVKQISAGAVAVEVLPQEGAPSLHVEARVEAGGKSARALLEGGHTSLVALEVDGVRVTERPAWASGPELQTDPTWEGWELGRVVALADVLDAEDQAWLLATLETNLEACGCTGDDEATTADRAEAVAAAGSRARMEGRPVTVVTSGFSGNQGLVAAIPVWAVAEEVGAERSALARALGTSHLVGSYVRASTGVLSSFCNAVHAASAGAAAGCAQLLGGGAAELELACKLVLATSAGVLCDGGKPACSLKVGLGAGQAVHAAERAVRGGAVSLADGLADESFDEMLANLAQLAQRAMPRVDEEVLEIVLGKCP